MTGAIRSAGRSAPWSVAGPVAAMFNPEIALLGQLGATEQPPTRVRSCGPGYPPELNRSA